MLPLAVVAETTHSTLSGKVYLPNNEVAPSGGVAIKLNVSTDNGSVWNRNDDISVTKLLSIPRGENTLAYSIMIPKSTNKKAQYVISYTVGDGYAPFGYYSDKGTIAVKADETLVDLNAGNQSGVDIEILPGRKISGDIILGNRGTVPLKDMSFTMIAIQEGSKSNTTDDDIIITKEVEIEKGDEKESYSLIVPLNTIGNGYKVYYKYKDGTYLENGYYNVDGTSRDEEQVTLVDVSNDVSGIDLITLPFTNICGKVSLPEEEEATEDGIEVNITALYIGSLSSKNDDFYIRQMITIPEDNHSTNYSLTVPIKNEGYILSYSTKVNTGYDTTGYYCTDGTKTSKSSASIVETDEDTVTDIDLTILGSSNPSPTPTPIPEDDEKYDLNGDGSIDVFDLLELAKVIVKQYDRDEYWKNIRNNNQWGHMDEEDLEVFGDVFKPFVNNRYKMKWFNSQNQWFNNWNRDCDDLYDWKDSGDWKNWFQKWYQGNEKENKNNNKKKRE